MKMPSENLRSVRNYGLSTYDTSGIIYGFIVHALVIATEVNIKHYRFSARALWLRVLLKLMKQKWS